MSTTVEFLQWLRPDGPWLLTAIHPETQEQTTRLLHTAAQVEAFVTEYNQACNVYYHVNATGKLSKRAGNNDVVAVEFIHTDLDPRDGETSAAGKARYLHQLNGSGIAPMPSVIVDSGNGLNCLWRLAAPLPLPSDPQQRELLIADVEERNRALVLALGGTAETRNIDRILRLPGTTNFPNEAKRKQGRTICQAVLVRSDNAHYQLNDFAKLSFKEKTIARGRGRAAFTAYINELREKMDVASWADIQVDVASLPVSDRIKQVINGDAEAMGAYTSRSEAVLAVLTAMTVSRCPEALMAAVLLQKPIGQHVRERRRDQRTWAPGEPMFMFDTVVVEGGLLPRKGLTALNLYRGPRCAAGDAKAVQPWLDHVHKLYPGDAEHIITWLAQRVQQPGVKINHVLLLGGAMRIGKDTILVPVRYAIGPWNFDDISPPELLGRFNPFLKKVLVRVSEIRDLGDVNRFTFYDHSKALFASPPEVLRVNEKHIREYDIMNCVGFILTSNYRTGGIYLPPEDRRHYVAWSECILEDFADDYFPKLHRWYEEEGNRNVAAYLRQLDISAFDPKTPPKQTQAFLAMANYYRYESPAYVELRSAFDDMQYPPAVALHQLAVSPFLDSWLNDQKNRSDIPRRMEACGYEKLPQPEYEGWPVESRWALSRALWAG